MLFSTDWTLVAHDEMSATGHNRKVCVRNAAGAAGRASRATNGLRDLLPASGIHPPLLMPALGQARRGASRSKM